MYKFRLIQSKIILGLFPPRLNAVASVFRDSDHLSVLVAYLLRQFSAIPAYRSVKIRKIMMKKLIPLVMVMCCALGAVAETPKEGAEAILKLLEKREYSTLFQQRYSEWYKVDDVGKDPAEAVEKLSSRWERNYTMMVDLFSQLTDADFQMSTSETPQESETGEVAAGTILIDGKDVSFRLYKMKSGLWGFHL